MALESQLLLVVLESQLLRLLLHPLADKKAACACIKSSAKQINANAEAAKALPGDCGITVSFTISSNVDCSKCLHHLFHSNAFNF